MARTSKTTLNDSGRRGHSCLIPDLRGNTFSFLPLKIMFAEGLSYIAFIMLRYVPLECQGLIHFDFLALGLQHWTPVS